MKRSKMIKLMHDADKEWYTTSPNEITHLCIHDFILEKLEEVGMLPPERFKPRQEINYAKLIPTHEWYRDEGVYGIYANEWEPEDET